MDGEPGVVLGLVSGEWTHFLEFVLVYRLSRVVTGGHASAGHVLPL